MAIQQANNSLTQEDDTQAKKTKIHQKHKKMFRFHKKKYKAIYIFEF